MNPATNHHVRPGLYPLWPATTALPTDGVALVAVPAGLGYETYEVPLTRLAIAKAGVPTSGTQQVQKLTFTSAVGAAGTGTITVALTSAALGRTVTATTATLANNATVTDIATAVALALNNELTADDDTKITVTSSVGVVLVAGSAVADATLLLEETARTVTDGAANNTTTANVAAVLGTVADFLGQQSINGTTVYVATSTRNNTWTAVN